MAEEEGQTDSLNVVVIAGVRGSGRTLSLRLLEDRGYTGIDNLPPSVIPQLVEDSLKHEHGDSLVIVAETRTPAAVSELQEAVNALRNLDVRVTAVFLDASQSTLLDRLGLASRTDSGSREQEVRSELMQNRKDTDPLREVADIVMDTSSVSPLELKERLSAAIEGQSLSRTMKLEISSFGFKYAAFIGDLVFDVRFIPNPYYVSELRPLTGQDPACSDFVFRTKEARMFVETISGLVKTLIPAYIAQGRSSLRIGIGCTGGHHRSVAVAEALGQALISHADSVVVRHRELQGSVT